jgi:hypothetical protein
MRTRRAVVVGLAVLAALALGGCTEVVSLVNKANIDVGLQKLTTRLEEIPSVTTVTPTAKITPEYGYTVDVQVVVDELVEQDLLAVVVAVTETFAKDAFSVADDLAFELSSVDGAQLWLSPPYMAPTEELQQEIHYWIALSAVYPAPLSMQLWGRSRVISVYNDVPEEPDWAALRAVPDPSTAVKQWYLGGLDFSYKFPPDAVLDLRDSLAGLATDETEFVSLDQYAPDYANVQFFTPGAGDSASPLTSSAWPRAITAVQLIIDARLPLVTFAYYADGNLGISQVHLGACDLEVAATEVDEALWEALAASNLELPEGSGAGYCGFE